MPRFTFFLIILIWGSFFNTLEGQDALQDQEIPSLLAHLNDPETGGISADSMLQVAVKYAQTEPSLSNSYASRALSSSFANENPPFRANVLLNYGHNLNKQGDYNKALELLKEGLDISTSIGDKKIQMAAYNSLGIYNNDRGNNVTATEYYIKSLTLARELNDTFGILRPYVNLTGIFLEQNRTEKSLEYGLNGLQLSQEFKHTRAEGFLRNNIAMAFIEQGNPQKAEEHLLASLEIAKEFNEPERIARIHSNLCRVNQMKESYNTAKMHCEQASNYLSKIDNPRSEMLHSIQYGWYYFKVNDLTNAQQKAERALTLGDAASIEQHKSGAYELLHSIFKKRGEYEKALAANEQYMALNFSTENIEKNTKIARLEDEHLSLLKEKEEIESKMQIAQLEKESILSTAQRNYALGLAFILGILGIALYFWLNYKSRTNKILQEKNANIEEQNMVIQEALVLKETLLKEIHHRVKNNLQIISSLLNLQTKKISDENVLETINEGKNRVEAMSLIHQNLYQSDHLTAIKMQDYLEQLMSHLDRSFKNNTKDIKFKIDAPDVSFDIDTAIPIGLIVNELVSNSYKHAFQEKDHGTINILLKTVGQEKFCLQVIDDGKGMDTNVNLKKSKSLGLKLVNSLGVRQLKGDLALENRDGTSVSLTFQQIKKVA